MLTIAYHFHVLPRHHSDFRHAWRAAEDTLKKVIGLRSCQLLASEHKRQPFTLILNWDNEASFNRFTRTWVGVWAINGMGLQRDDFFAPTQTRVNEPHSERSHQCAA